MVSENERAEAKKAFKIPKNCQIIWGYLLLFFSVLKFGREPRVSPLECTLAGCSHYLRLLWGTVSFPILACGAPLPSTQPFAANLSLLLLSGPRPQTPCAFSSTPCRRNVLTSTSRSGRATTCGKQQRDFGHEEWRGPRLFLSSHRLLTPQSRTDQPGQGLPPDMDEPQP